ncbi:alpha/beta hydrolase fold [Trichococcus palustris]|jgi:pimeloyl-ACP methyl ester carboxylesterase|uniref:Alpha/beta hydrolase fold n=1 Tax=Trichococcus palustris TaxID=140314 RepID=A0A143YF66_9LACT|nr:alpha/beta hydrolase [Trichococcus palustris]CZQ85468.1 alpha/beta hydrolase fold [Trichococcus palustris]SFK56006.1 Pimeloyl-ACP methyl ester carboxylesterase [Trichococcus palustris]
MYIRVNDTNLWYETKGTGQPFILLHGNGESREIFTVLITELSKNFSVYAIDSRGHGKSSKTNQLSYGLMMEDVASFITELKLEKPLLYGFSDGGIIGLLLASKYSDMLSKLIISGANTQPNGVKKSWAMLSQLYYLLTRSKKMKMTLEEPNISKEDLKKIHIPVLVLAGKNDLIKVEDTKYIANNIPNSTLTILDRETHSSYVVNSPKLYKIIKAFIENNQS